MLGELLAAAQGGRSSVVLISGEAGVGKTTLADGLILEASRAGVQVLTGHCYDLTMTPPYGPWIELVSQCPTDLATPAVLRRGDGSGIVASKEASFEEARAYFAALAAVRPALLVLEDMHWADAASLDLLRVLARQLRGLSLILVATYRDDELAPDHPLYRLLPLLVREARAERLNLRPIDDVAVRELIAGRYRLNVRGEVRLVQYVQAHAEGNPFFINEVLRTLEEQQILYQTGASWALGDLMSVPVPPLVSQIIASRLDRLSHRTRELLSLAAVIGQEPSLDLWQMIGSMTDDELSETIEIAQHARLLRASTARGSVRFVHALVHEAIHDSISLPRRRRWHRRIAETLEITPHPDPDHMAWHYQQAGDGRAIDWLTRAGEWAAQAYSLEMAAERFAQAATLLEQDATRSVDRGWLLYRTGRMLRNNDPFQALHWLELAKQLAISVSDAVLAAYALFECGLLRCFIGDIRQGIEQMQAGLAAIDLLPDDHTPPGSATTKQTPGSLPTTPIERRRQAGTLCLWLSLVGRLDEARVMAEQYLAEVSDLAGDTAVIGPIADAWACLGRVAAALGRPDEASRAFTRCCDANRLINHHVQVGTQLWFLLRNVVIPYQADRVNDRRQLVADIEAMFIGWNDAAQHIIWPQFARLWLRFLEGDWPDEEDLAECARRLTGSIVGTAHHFHLLGVFARHRGRPEIAWEYVARVIPDGPATGPGNTFFDYTIDMICLAADLSLDADDLDTARSWLEALDRWHAWTGAIQARSEGSRLWARFWRASADLQRAREHAEEAVRLASEPWQPLALIVAHRFMGQLALEIADVDEAGKHFQASLTLADACSVPFERALTLLELAALHAATGTIDDARSLLDAVRSICAPLVAAPTLARANALEAALEGATGTAHHPAGLTAREVDVLRLVARGLTDAEVAEQLFIARRTVNTHLTSIYSKLGVNSRAAATRIAVEQGIA